MQARPPQLSGAPASSSYLATGREFDDPSGYEDDSAAMATDPSSAGGARLDLGLMEGSDIDSGWLSFMQDCGIIDASLTPPLTLQQPLLACSESVADADDEAEREAEGEVEMVS